MSSQSEAASAAILQALHEARSSGAPLGERLHLFTARLAQIAPHYAGHYEGQIMRLAGARAGALAPRVGQAMPELVLPDDGGRLVSLTELLAEGPLVLSFNRGHWCEFCRIELGALCEIHGEVRRRGAGIAAILPDSRACLVRLRQDDRLPFPLLRDADCALSLRLGLAIAVDEAIAGLMREDGIELAELQDGIGQTLPIPATYVIAPDRRIVAAHVDVDFRRRLAMEAVLAALRELA